MLLIRETVSFLLSHGHHCASLYPIPRLFIEAEIIRKRINRDKADDAMLYQLSIGSLIDKKTSKDFIKRIKEMTSG